jgi:hypothetical protein
LYSSREIETYLTKAVSGTELQIRIEEFERLQTELESSTELLSNLVARKRLRASKSQIIIATRGARMKRIEFEELLNVWCIQDEQESINNTSIKSRNTASSSGNNGVKPSPIMNRFRYNLHNNVHNNYYAHPTHTATQSNLSAREVPRNHRMRNTGQYLESSPLSNPASQYEDTSPGSDFSRMLAALNSVLDDTPRQPTTTTNRGT